MPIEIWEEKFHILNGSKGEEKKKREYPTRKGISFPQTQKIKTKAAAM